MSQNTNEAEGIIKKIGLMTLFGSLMATLLLSYTHLRRTLTVRAHRPSGDDVGRMGRLGDGLVMEGVVTVMGRWAGDGRGRCDGGCGRSMDWRWVGDGSSSDCDGKRLYGGECDE